MYALYSALYCTTFYNIKILYQHIWWCWQSRFEKALHTLATPTKVFSLAWLDLFSGLCGVYMYVLIGIYLTLTVDFLYLLGWGRTCAKFKLQIQGVENYIKQAFSMTIAHFILYCVIVEDKFSVWESLFFLLWTSLTKSTTAESLWFYCGVTETNNLWQRTDTGLQRTPTPDRRHVYFELLSSYSLNWH